MPEPLSFDAFIKAARDSLNTFQKRWRRYNKMHPKEFPLDGTEQEWLTRFSEHVADINAMRTGKDKP